MTRRALVWGAVVAVVYIAAALLAQHGMPLRPLFDGLAPPAPYRWVKPPSELRDGNQQPLGAKQDLALTRDGNEEASIATLDSQATLIVPRGAFVSAKDKSVHVEVTPKDPTPFGKPPSRLSYSGNAYDITATFRPSGTPASPSDTVTILLSYPIHATKILQRTGNAWTALPTTSVPAALQVFAKTKALGAVVAAGPAVSGSLRWWTLGIASGIAALLGTAFGIRERRRLARTGE